jgi:hypothetical protein
MICLRSARAVIQIKGYMDNEEPAVFPESYRLWAVTHHVLMATMVLLMDLYLNCTAIETEERRDEIKKCCMLLERSQDESSLAQQGVDLVQGFLARWCLKINISEASNHGGMEASRHVLNSTAWELDRPSDHGGSTKFENTPQDGESRPSSWNLGGDEEFIHADRWSEFFDFTAKLDIPQWQEIFTDLSDQNI